MTPEIMWSVLVTMGAITIASVLKVVEHARKLHLADKELSGSREKLDSLKQQHEQSVSDFQKLHIAEKEKLAERISNLEIQLHIFTSSEREEEQKRLIAEQQLVDQLNDEIIQ